MLRHSRYLVGCCGVAFGLVSFLVGLEVLGSTPASSVEQQSPAGINRTLKGDRLPLVPDKSRNAGNGPSEMGALSMRVCCIGIVTHEVVTRQHLSD